jgi:hypothetical protein
LFFFKNSKRFEIVDEKNNAVPVALVTLALSDSNKYPIIEVKAQQEAQVEAPVPIVESSEDLNESKVEENNKQDSSPTSLQNGNLEVIENQLHVSDVCSGNDLISRNLESEKDVLEHEKTENQENAVQAGSVAFSENKSNKVENLSQCGDLAVALPIRESKSSNAQVFGENGSIYAVKKNVEQIEGDVCRMPTNKKSKMKGKRRLEANTAKKTFVLMLAFLTWRICYLIGLAARQSSASSVELLPIKYRAEVTFTQISFFSCFFNAFAFILVTDFFKMEAKRCFEKVWTKLTSYWLKLKPA